MTRFTLPRDLYHGKGALEALKTLQGKRAIICIGGFYEEQWLFTKSRGLSKRGWNGSGLD